MEELSKITAHIVRDPDFKVKATTGLIGGIAPTGEIYCELFVEHVKVPETATIHLKNNIKISEDNEGHEPSILREVHTALLLSPQHAYGIGEWLMQRAKEVADQMGAKLEKS